MECEKRSNAKGKPRGKYRKDPSKLSLHPFIKKLSLLLSDTSTSNIIVWEDDQGEGRIKILDPARLESEVLGRYFKHANRKSFFRQLNLHGFKKQSKQGQRPDTPVTYTNKYFLKNHSNLHFLIKRRVMKGDIEPKEDSEEQRDTLLKSLKRLECEKSRYLKDPNINLYITVNSPIFGAHSNVLLKIIQYMSSDKGRALLGLNDDEFKRAGETLSMQEFSYGKLVRKFVLQISSKLLPKELVEDPTTHSLCDNDQDTFSTNSSKDLVNYGECMREDKRAFVPEWFKKLIIDSKSLSHSTENNNDSSQGSLVKQDLFE